MPRKLPYVSVPKPRRRPSAAARGYCSRKHREWRLAVLRRDEWTCQDCGRVCTDKAEAHADHVSPIVQGTDYCEDGSSRYDVRNGKCRCIRCHSRKTQAENAGGKRIPADPRGGFQSSKAPTNPNHLLAARTRPGVFEGGGSNSQSPGETASGAVRWPVVVDPAMPPDRLLVGGVWIALGVPAGGVE
jgi:5-methylcytosine-specific restriction endonuclease McrA